jgi:hypothetical protein
MNRRLTMPDDKEKFGEVIQSMCKRFDHELISMSAEEIASDWHWKWDNSLPTIKNIYHFCDAIELHKRRWRKWEEHHYGIRSFYK